MLDGWAGKLSRFWDCVCLAGFSFSGNEVIGIICVETEGQRKVLPKAVRRISYRIILYYVLSVLVLGLTVSCNDPLLSRQESRDPVRNYPGGFIVMAERAGIPILPDLINAIMILAAFSVATVNLFVAVPSSSLRKANLSRVKPFRLWRTRRWRQPSSNPIRFILSSSSLTCIAWTHGGHKILSCKSVAVEGCRNISVYRPTCLFLS
jgi:amino acid permease